MEVRFYFNPVDFSLYSHNGRLNWKNSLGSVIEKNTQAILNEKRHKINIAIIGVPFDFRNSGYYSPVVPDKIRTELYQLSKLTGKLNIADFGNLKPTASMRSCHHALRDIVDYFNELKITTVIIGGSQDLSLGVCEAFRNDAFFSYSTVDALFDIKSTNETLGPSNYLSRLLGKKNSLFQFNLIGYQSLYVDQENLGKIKSLSNNIRLGSLRDNIKSVEPVLRNTDFLSFDFNAIKHADAPGSLLTPPNGLRSEEACQVAKYAGLSTRLKVFGLFDIIAGNDMQNLTVSLAAQMIWYFLDGYCNRSYEMPGSGKSITMYRVELENIDNPLIFYRNTVTNQWWIQVESTDGRKFYFACSEDEYEQASNNEIPEVWLKYIQKIDQVLK